MRTIHLATGDLGGFRDALRKSRDETLIIYQGGYRIVMARGEVISSSGHSDIDVTPVEDDLRPKRRYSPSQDAYGPRLWTDKQQAQFDFIVKPSS